MHEDRDKNTDTKMTNCKYFDDILRRGQPDEIAALEAHAASCDPCRLQLDLDRSISAAAPSLHREWDSPSLWPRICEALATQSSNRPWWSLDRLRDLFSFNLRPALATVAVALLAVAGTWYFLRHNGPKGPGPDPQAQQRLLTEQALRDAESAETIYLQSIDRLAALAEPRLRKTDSSLMVSYREKLLVLDSAINELRLQADANRFNAHLRTELTSLYREKQHTLQQVLQEN